MENKLSIGRDVVTIAGIESMQNGDQLINVSSGAGVENSWIQSLCDADAYTKLTKPAINHA